MARKCFQSRLSGASGIFSFRGDLHEESYDMHCWDDTSLRIKDISKMESHQFGRRRVVSPQRHSSIPSSILSPRKGQKQKIQIFI
jgi:hypothetical protein